MKKKISLLMMLFMLVLLVGCSIKKSDQKGEKKTDTTSVKKENTIVWAIRDDSEIPGKNVRKFNQLLQKKGYDLAVKFLSVRADTSYEDPAIYHNALKKEIKAGNVDLAYCEYMSALAPGEMMKLLQSGLLLELSDWLHSDEGKEVYELYDPDTWKGASVFGKNYIIPDETVYAWTKGIIGFEKDHVSEKAAKSWDGSWSGLWKRMKKIKLGKDERMFLGYPTPDNFEGDVDHKKYQMEDDLVYNIRTGEIQQPFALQEFHDFLYFLHQCYEKGYLTEEQKMNSGCGSSEEELICAAKRQYVMAFGIEVHDDDRRNQTSFLLPASIGGGTAVAANSEKKDKALELIRILRTDDELANTLVWGEGKKENVLDPDGYVKKSFGKRLNVTQWSELGVNDGIFQSRDFEPLSTDMRSYRKKCENSSKRLRSRILGFWPDYTGLEHEISEYQRVLSENVDCWQEKNFEEAYRTASKNVEYVSKKLVKKLNQQMDQYKKTMKKD